jgi:endonuclease/exonuclease/phosphatase family metal-dependent hydrolase
MIRDKLTQLDATLPIIVTGDFNCTPDQKPYQVMIDTKGADSRTPLFDARRQSESQPTGPNSTWNGFRAVVPDRRIDFIFVGPGVKVTEHQTLDMQAEGRFPSDHLPVVADLKIAN